MSWEHIARGNHPPELERTRVDEQALLWRDGRDVRRDGGLATAAAGPSAGETYTLRYQFHPGETLRWDVEHRTRVRTSVSGTTETVETLSKSLKVWRVKEVKPDGEVTFEHSVEWLQMRQKYADRDEVRYDSRTGAKPPACFAGMDKSVGVPLAVVTMDAKGKVLKRQRNDVRAMPHNEGSMTIPLPDEAVPVGYTWSHPDDIDVPLETGGIKKIKAIQQFTLEQVKTGVATIHVSTNIITPVADPAIESKLVQRRATGGSALISIPAASSARRSTSISTWSASAAAPAASTTSTASASSSNRRRSRRPRSRRGSESSHSERSEESRPKCACRDPSLCSG